MVGYIVKVYKNQKKLLFNIQSCFFKDVCTEIFLTV